MKKSKPSTIKAATKKRKIGPDGTVVESRRVRTGTEAVSTIKVRCRPGTFEWRYGRFGNAQYHAGAEFARLWERAGIASSGQSLGDSSSNGEAFRGQPDGRIRALDRVTEISKEIGGPMKRRLVAYCVEGRTPREMVETYNRQVTDRQMSDTLDVDLIELAKAMNYA